MTELTEGNFAQRTAEETEEDWQSNAGPSVSELFSPLQSSLRPSVRNFGISQGQDRSLTLQKWLRLHDEREIDEGTLGRIPATFGVDI